MISQLKGLRHRVAFLDGGDIMAVDGTWPAGGCYCPSCVEGMSVSSALNGWRRSRACVGGECVEVARLGDGVAVRQNRGHLPGILYYSTDEWLAFVHGVKAGDFDDLLAPVRPGRGPVSDQGGGPRSDAPAVMAELQRPTDRPQMIGVHDGG